VGFPLRVAVFPSVIGLLAGASGATYSVTAQPESRTARVEIALEQGKAAAEFRMCAWAPGDYRIVNFGDLVTGIEFKKGGEAVSATRGADANAWVVEGGADLVVYTLKQRTSIFTEDLRVRDNEMFFNGPAVLGYFGGHQKESHTLRIAVRGGETAVCSLDTATSTDPGWVTFSAPDYDTLIDAPVVAGSAIRTKEFTVGGKPHYIVAFNRSSQIDLEEYASVCSLIVSEARAMFGELPYKRYMFLLDAGGPGGGLEHADSARLALAGSASGTAEFLAHEFFHAFNVKRIRASVLGPFDYTKPAITGSLWWLEGTTDYYATVLCVRAGLTSRPAALDDLGYTAREVGFDADRFRVSADESSRRVWEARNSSGYGINYYSAGKVIGFLLDLKIRAETRGERCLDDVMTALYAECKNGKPGYSERRIRELCIFFGGERLGDFYDRCVTTPGEMPYDEVLPRFGFTMQNFQIREDPFATPDARSLALAWPNRR
jgi:predicted metalloprotease with PDZ domain